MRSKPLGRSILRNIKNMARLYFENNKRCEPTISKTVTAVKNNYQQISSIPAGRAPQKYKKDSMKNFFLSSYTPCSIKSGIISTCRDFIRRGRLLGISDLEKKKKFLRNYFYRAVYVLPTQSDLVQQRKNSSRKLYAVKEKTTSDRS